MKHSHLPVADGQPAGLFCAYLPDTTILIVFLEPITYVVAVFLGLFTEHRRRDLAEFPLD
eukprot:2247323-Amphidinium_carterae.1